MLLSLAPAGPVWGRFIPFLTSFPKVSRWPTFPAFPFPGSGCWSGISRGTKHHQSQLGGQSCPKSLGLCLPRVGLQAPGMLWGSAASSCLIPLAWSSRLSGTEGSGSLTRILNLFVPLLAVCPGPCCHQGHSHGRGLSGSSKRAWILGKQNKKLRSVGNGS